VLNCPTGRFQPHNFYAGEIATEAERDDAAINRLGINRNVHFGVGSEERRNQIGRQLAPVSVWGEWGKRIEAAPQSLRGGFTNLTVQETREGGKGSIQATVQPSVFIKGNSGIFVNVNDEHVLQGDAATNA
jgi:hypothetical protein